MTYSVNILYNKSKSTLYSPESQSVRMSKSTLTALLGLARGSSQTYPYGNSGRQRVNVNPTNRKVYVEYFVLMKYHWPL